MKELDSNNKKFDRVLENLILKRRNEVKSSSVSVSKIINEHSGTFSIKNNKKDKGTIITILLPKTNE